MDAALFISAVLTAAAALGVVLPKKPLHSALSLVLTLFFVAAQFALLNAHFIAALQVMIYAGAIMVLVIFVIMLLGIDAETPEEISFGSNSFSLALAGAFLGLLYWGFNAGESALAPGFLARGQAKLPEDFGTVEQIGKELFTRQIFPFELASVLLLVGIVGAVLLAHDRKRPLPEGRGLKAKQQEGR